jgi:rhodanese-related sulfurtransferase
MGSKGAAERTEKILCHMKTVKELTILIGISIIAAFGVNFFSPNGIALVGQWDISKGVVNAREKNHLVLDELEIEDVTYAKTLYDSGNVLFVDARSREDYKDGHVKGAYSLPVGDFDEQIDEFLERFALDRPIVTYCSGRTCEDSHHLAQLLISRGYQNTSVMIDGFPGWKDEGYPVE